MAVLLGATVAAIAPSTVNAAKEVDQDDDLGLPYVIGGDDIWSPFLISNDPYYAKELSSVFKKLGKSDPNLQLNGFEYSRSLGYIVNDMGFVPSYTIAPAIPRSMVFTGQRPEVFRDVTAKEIMEVQKVARESVALGYQKSIQDQMRGVIASVESQLHLDKVSFGIVRDLSTGKIVGTVRLFEGYMQNNRVIIPAFEILREQGRLSAADEEKINKLVGKSPIRTNEMDEEITEVGQFYIDPSCSFKDRVHIRSLLLAWIDAALFKRKPNGIVVAHVTTAAHERKYIREFGFADEWFGNKFVADDRSVVEKILTTTSGAFQKRLAENVAEACSKLLSPQNPESD